MNGENWPAAGFADPAVNEGENGLGPQPSSIVIGEVLTTGVGEAQDVRSTCVVYLPQRGGVASDAFEPPGNCTSMRENGSCGVLSKVAVSWPVAGSRSTL